MTSEYRAKTFKSGNSVALRLPKGLGIVEGREMKVREEQGRYIVEPIPVAESKKKIDLSAIAGSMPWLELIVREEDDYDDLPREWQLLKTLQK